MEDATQLSYMDQTFDVVISGGCLLHIPEYTQAIKETVRVSRKYVVFHRTPIVHMSGETVYTKKAYGVETFETHFNEQEFVQKLKAENLSILGINTHAMGSCRSYEPVFMKSYLCVKST